MGVVLGCRRLLVGGESPPWWADLLAVEQPTEVSAAHTAAMIWAESSNRMWRFSKSEGIKYIHVLQPNQYFPDSKPFSEEEKARAFGFARYGEVIRDHYHLLREDDIEAENFRDQRLLFKDVPDTLYADYCCHLNDKGMSLIASDIIERFASVFEAALTDNVRSATINRMDRVSTTPDPATTRSQ